MDGTNLDDFDHIRVGIRCYECLDKYEGCQECCPHWEYDHFICMNCEKELDMGRAIDRAMDCYDE